MPNEPRQMTKVEEGELWGDGAVPNMYDAVIMVRRPLNHGQDEAAWLIRIQCGGVHTQSIGGCMYEGRWTKRRQTDRC